MVQLEIKLFGPENRMPVQVKFSVKGATIIQRLPSTVTLLNNREVSLPVGVILTGDDSPVLKY